MASSINASTSGAGGVITTADNTGILNIQTVSTTALTIDASQNVGIGTATPGSKLELSSSATSAAAGFTSTNTNSAGYSTLQLRNTGTSGRTYTIAVGGNTSGNPGAFYVYDDTAPAERMRIDSSGNLSFNSGYGSAAVAYGCRAWVNFNGTGTVAIRASGNVSSITDNGTGLYTVNLTTAMPDANYSVSSIADDNSGGNAQVVNYRSATTSTLLLGVWLFGVGRSDPANCCAAIFR